MNTQLLQVDLQAMNTILNRASADVQEFAAGVQAAGLSAQVGTAHALAETGASTQEAALSVQAQGAQIESVLSLMGQLNSLSAANAQIQQDYLSGIGQLIGTGLGLGFGGGFGGRGGSTSSGGGGGGGAGTSIVPNLPAITPGNLPATQGFLGR